MLLDLHPGLAIARVEGAAAHLIISASPVTVVPGPITVSSSVGTASITAAATAIVVGPTSITTAAAGSTIRAAVIRIYELSSVYVDKTDDVEREQSFSVQRSTTEALVTSSSRDAVLATFQERQ